MFKFLLLTLLFISVGNPVKANMETYGIFLGALVVKNSLSHASKQVAAGKELLANPSSAIASITLRCISDAVGLFLLKETGDSVLQSFGDVAPDWLKPKKNIRLQAENIRLQQDLENLKRASVATNSVFQAERINKLKEALLGSFLEHALSETDKALSAKQLWFYSADPSINIAALLNQLSEQVLNLYPGRTNEDRSFIVDSQKSPTETGESPFYNETLVAELAQKFHLKSRIPPKVAVYLKETLEQLVKNNRRPKAEYFQHFLGLLGIDIELPEQTTESDNGTQSTDL